MSIRISSGSLRSRLLKSPRGVAVRPTSGRVREALFSILGQRLDGLTVLDLFAGAGTLGVEAASRGASRLVAVERDRATSKLLAQNLEILSDLAETEVLAMDTLRALPLLAHRGDRFDLVFLDPPYGKGLAARCLEELALISATLIADGGRIVAETEVHDELPSTLEGLVLVQRRVYGPTALTLYSRET
jgi:16S rRNA (guanine966-N2)-methyltransferase